MITKLMFTQKRWLLTITILLTIAMFATVSVIYNFSSLDQILFPTTESTRASVEVREASILVKSILSSLNIGISTILLYVYIRIYIKTKMKFSIGLIAFSSGMLANSIISDPLIFHRAIRVIGLPVIAEQIFVFFALISILYVSLK